MKNAINTKAQAKVAIANIIAIVQVTRQDLVAPLRRGFNEMLAAGEIKKIAESIGNLHTLFHVPPPKAAPAVKKVAKAATLEQIMKVKTELGRVAKAGYAAQAAGYEDLARYIWVYFRALKKNDLSTLQCDGLYRCIRECEGYDEFPLYDIIDG